MPGAAALCTRLGAPVLGSRANTTMESSAPRPIPRFEAYRKRPSALTSTSLAQLALGRQHPLAMHSTVPPRDMLRTLPRDGPSSPLVQSKWCQLRAFPHSVSTYAIRRVRWKAMCLGRGPIHFSICRWQKPCPGATASQRTMRGDSANMPALLSKSYTQTWDWPASHTARKLLPGANRTPCARGPLCFPILTRTPGSSTAQDGSAQRGPCRQSSTETTPSR
mmetsp:Transcript_72090/g.163640  ORF Transcript_72090/g.163640 Transcript_72090/m.163640 type:complete len:221 (-) Transcript_72090:376-1038(-)